MEGEHQRNDSASIVIGVLLILGFIATVVLSGAGKDRDDLPREPSVNESGAR